MLNQLPPDLQEDFDALITAHDAHQAAVDTQAQADSDLAKAEAAKTLADSELDRTANELREAVDKLEADILADYAPKSKTAPAS